MTIDGTLVCLRTEAKLIFLVLSLSASELSAFLIIIIKGHDICPSWCLHSVFLRMCPYWGSAFFEPECLELMPRAGPGGWWETYVVSVDIFASTEVWVSPWFSTGHWQILACQSHYCVTCDRLYSVMYCNFFIYSHKVAVRPSSWLEYDVRARLHHSPPVFVDFFHPWFLRNAQSIFIFLRCSIIYYWLSGPPSVMHIHLGSLTRLSRQETIEDGNLDNAKEC